MQRLAGVVASVVLLAAGSILCFTFALIVAAVVFFLPMPADAPQALKAFLFVPVGLFAGIAVWAMVTAVGLWRMRSWARISILVFAALMVFFSSASLLFVFFVEQFLPPNVEIDTDALHRVRMMMALFYGTPLVLGIGWLVYFSRARVRQAMIGGQVVDDPRKIPLSIAVIAWHMLAFAAVTLPQVWLRWPAMMLGIVFTDGSAAAIHALWMLALAFGGTGLLKFKPAGYRLTVWLCYFTLLNLTLNTALPGLEVRMMELMQSFPWQSIGMEGFGMDVPVVNVWLSLVTGYLFTAIPLWYLHTRKEKYLAACRARAAAEAR